MIRAGSEEVNLGQRLARDMGFKLGDTLTVVTQTAYGSLAAMNLKVVGIYSFGVPSVDGRFFYMPLDRAQQLLDLPGSATEVFVLIKNMDAAPVIAAEINHMLRKFSLEGYAVRPWQDQGLVFTWLRIAKLMYGVIYFIVLLLASFTILNTMFMSVLERTKEIGTMKSLGMRNRQVVGVVVSEAMLIGFFASLIGAALGAGIAYYLSVEGIDFSAIFNKMTGTYDFPVSTVYRAVFRWEYVLTGFGFGILFSILAALPPALRAARMRPTEALREI
jgi:putative ABC transport system permease protein